MKVTRKNREEKTIKELPTGTVFIEDNTVFMKVHYEGYDIECPRCGEEIDLNRNLSCLGVALETGELFDFEPYAVVEVINCEVTEI